MRCLAVADALRETDAKVVFVTSDDGPRQTIESRGFEDISLGSDWRDIVDGLDALRGECEREGDRPTVLVDTYSVTREYVDSVSEFADVCYLGSKGGDLGNLSLIVNYSTKIDADHYRGTYGPRGTRLLLGAGYAPLRRRFSEMYVERHGAVERVLLTTGNTDPQGFVPAFLRAALREPALSEVSFDVVVGGMFMDGDVLDSIGADCLNVRLHRGVRDMALLMAGCDAAVSASGTTVYELSAVGLPSVTFAMVGEQVESAESLASLGAVAYAGALSDGIGRVVSHAVSQLVCLVSDPGAAALLAARAHGLIDGLGAEKIAKEIMAL